VGWRQLLQGSQNAAAVTHAGQTAAADLTEQVGNPGEGAR
jgi:hypothetical protein